MSNQRSALVVFGVALVASVATSPIEWDLWESADGAAVTLDDATPAASLSIGFDSRDIPEEAMGTLTVGVEVLDIVDAVDAPLTLDFVLVEEAAEGDVEVGSTIGWTLAPASDENSFPERVYLSVQDLPPSGAWRVDVDRTAGVSARLEWRVDVEYEAPGLEEAEGEPDVTITLAPGR